MLKIQNKAGCLFRSKVHALRFFRRSIPAICLGAILTMTQIGYAQDGSKTITGAVKGANGEPLAGVTVMVKGAKKAVATAADGTYTITVPSHKSVLVFSSVGYTAQELTVGNQSILVISLSTEASSLSDVVVIGYGTKKKSAVTGAVSTVDAKMFQDRGAVSSPLAALQGQVPGVVVTRNSGAPGKEGWNFQIRGASSVNGVTPLVIVDGMPLPDNNALNTINPADIESMTVLKDASTAIYGARAAGGVVVITTKRAKSGVPTIQYDGSVSYKAIGLKPQLMNGQQFGYYLQQAMDNDYLGNPDVNNTWYKLALAIQNPPDSGWYDFVATSPTGTPASNPLNPGFGDVKDITFFKGNWQDALWGNTLSTQHNISVAARTDKSGYRLSLGYMNDGANLKWGNNSNSRYNLRLTHDLTVNKLKLETNLSLERQDIVQPTLINTTLGLFQQPGFPIATKDGKPYAWGTQLSPNWQAELGGDRKEHYTRVYTNIKGTYTFYKDLKLIGSAFYNANLTDVSEQQKKIEWWNYAGTIQAVDNPNQASTYYLRQSVKSPYFNLNAYLEYTRQLANQHDIAVTVGRQFEKNLYNQFTSRVTGIPNDNIPTLSSGEVVVAPSENANHWALSSYFGRASYSFKNKYFIEGNARYDGTSKFIESKRWSGFGAVALSWRISQEHFMQDQRLFSDLKLRVSRGSVGSQSGIGNYDYLERLASIPAGGATSSGGIYLGSGQTGYVIPQEPMVSTLRTWERIISNNIGVDYALLNGRLSGSLDYFIKENNNMLLSSKYAGTLGATAPALNIGKLKSWGWESSISWRDQIGKINYHASFNITDNNNKLVSFLGNNIISMGLNTKEGYALNSYFGLLYTGKVQSEKEAAELNAMSTNDGISMPSKAFNSTGVATNMGVRPGDNQYADVNGDGKFTLPEDLVYLGRLDPRYSYALNLGANYKGFDITAIFQGVGKRTVYRNDTWTVPFGAVWQGQSTIAVGKFWSKENSNGYYPNISAGFNGASYNQYNYQISSWSVQNGAYTRLKNLVVGYTLPDALVKRAGIQRLRIYFSGNDVWETTKINDGWDPEASQDINGLNRYPFNRLYTGGINLTF